MIDLFILLGCIFLLIVAVTSLKIHPIPALLITGLILGLAMGGTVESVTQSLLNGFGDTLKWIGLIILFGALLGEILFDTGGADVIADGVIGLFGAKYLPLSMAVIGFLIGIPVFMDVAYLMLVPTILILSKKSGHSVLLLGLSLAMSLTVAHALIPPTPGPLAVAALLEIEVGDIISLNMIVAIAAILGGLAWINWNKNKLYKGSSHVERVSDTPKKHLKGIKKILPFAAILVPLLLMSIGTLFPGNNPIMVFIKTPLWALVFGIAFALPLIESKKFSSQLNQYVQTAGAKSAIVILITGTGGAFGQVIKDTEIVGNLFADANGLAAMGIVVPFLLSFLFTTVTGSITVSLITASSIIAPLVTNGTLDATFTAAAIGTGSLGVIHVNSSFFWLFKEVHDLSVSKLLKSFSLLSAMVSIAGGITVLVIYFLVRL